MRSHLRSVSHRPDQCSSQADRCGAGYHGSTDRTVEAPAAAGLSRVCAFPVRLRQNPIRYDVRILINHFLFNQFVGLLPVTCPMCKLHILDVGWMSTLGYRDDVVDAWSKRTWVFQFEVHRFSADAAGSLRLVYFFLVLLKGTSVCAVSSCAFVHSSSCFRA